MAPLSVVLMLACLLLSSGAAGLRIGLKPKHIHSNPDDTASELMRDALRRDMSRHYRLVRRELASSGATIAAPTRNDGPQGLQYLMPLAIGTPPVAFPAIVDTGSNVIMTQCAPCGSKCGFEQTAPMYDPSASTTFAELPCNSSLRLGFCDAIDGGANAPPGCPCTRNLTSGGWGGAAGMVGLGRRGNLSLVSQLGAGRFSYCLTPYHDGNSTSTFFSGPAAALNDTGALSTPFVPSPSEGTKSTHYYLNLTGISLGNKLLSIPADAFSLSSDGSGGILIDSGWTTTLLVDVAYHIVRAEILSLATLAPESTPPPMPDMTLHFDGADMVLPSDNDMFLDSDGECCLWLHNDTAAEGSVLGNYQQQNIHFLYDRP
ncbi:hypothetical protein SETIT_8G129200v2 [Setaria italica]|uniref:Peptidase A1 domain-containing protein n=2 Tax=Setaria TaxID=4554 RepID=K3ZN35_SETIT|nr:hypothetical protein SETIT_8G129200v2 [Setaria italica]TKW00802.1 hypothetical protein SEVIR_8G136200v2 [Setaria viridis]